MGLVSGIKDRLTPRSLGARLGEMELRRAEAESAYGALSLAAAEGDPIAARRLVALERRRETLVAECRRLRAAESAVRLRETETATEAAAQARTARESAVQEQAVALRRQLEAIDADAERLAERVLQYRQGVDDLFATMRIDRVDPAVPDLLGKVGTNLRNTLAGRCPGLHPAGPFVVLGADRRPDIAQLKSAPDFPSGDFLVALMRRTGST
jgi:hypothetical protein